MKDVEKEIRDTLHEFAVSFRVESRETRQEDIAQAKSRLDKLYCEKYRVCHCGEPLSRDFPKCQKDWES